MAGFPRDDREDGDDDERNAPPAVFGDVVMLPIGGMDGFGISLAVSPGEKSHENEHGNHDDQHEQRTGADQIAFFHPNKTRWIQNSNIMLGDIQTGKRKASQHDQNNERDFENVLHFFSL